MTPSSVKKEKPRLARNLLEAVRMSVGADNTFATRRLLAQAVGLNESQLSAAVAGRRVLTKEFLDRFCKATGYRVTEQGVQLVREDAPPVPAATQRSGITTPANRVLAVVDAMNKLEDGDEQLLDDLVSFRTEGKTLGTRGFIKAIQDIRIIQGLLSNQEVP